MSNLIAILPERNSYVSITWQVNNFCNYRCSYCNEGNWSGKWRNEGLEEQLMPNLEKLIDHYRSLGYKDFKFFFSGGEPTLWKSLVPVMEYLKTKLGSNTSLGINTNFSRKPSWWYANYHLLDDVVASYHPEFVDDENYFLLAEFLQDKVNYLCLRMMVMEDRFEEILAVGERVRQLKNYNLEWVPLLKEMSTGAVPWEYTNPAITEFLSKNNFESKITVDKPSVSASFASIEQYNDGTVQSLNSNRLVAENRNFFKGWTCNVNESLFINPKGDVSAASCGQGPQLGNIFQTITFPSNSIICQKDYCHCGTDILITKKKNG